MSLLRRSHCTEHDLAALLDDELTLPQRVAVERHLATCAGCAALLTRLEHALEALVIELGLDQAEIEPPPAHWRVRTGVRVAGAGVLAGSVGALVVAGLLVRRLRHDAS